MAHDPLETDPRFWVLSEALASYVGDGDDPRAEADRWEAAVSLVLRGNDRLQLLVIKRARSERDPWSGHMALPGGRRDAADGTLLDTAVRETLEETGLDLAAGGIHLGRLEEVTPSSPRAPRLLIVPFVFGIGPEAEARVASTEVDQVYWVTLEHLRSPESRGTVDMPLPGGTRSFACFHVAGEIVWGLTYRILTQFLGVYSDSALDTAVRRRHPQT